MTGPERRAGTPTVTRTAIRCPDRYQRAAAALANVPTNTPDGPIPQPLPNRYPGAKPATGTHRYPTLQGGYGVAVDGAVYGRRRIRVLIGPPAGQQRRGHVVSRTYWTPGGGHPRRLSRNEGERQRTRPAHDRGADRR
jgi:hypothetical protein